MAPSRAGPPVVSIPARFRTAVVEIGRLRYCWVTVRYNIRVITTRGGRSLADSDWIRPTVNLAKALRTPHNHRSVARATPVRHAVHHPYSRWTGRLGRAGEKQGR